MSSSRERRKSNLAVLHNELSKQFGAAYESENCHRGYWNPTYSNSEKSGELSPELEPHSVIQCFHTRPQFGLGKDLDKFYTSATTERKIDIGSRREYVEKMMGEGYISSEIT